MAAVVSLLLVVALSMLVIRIGAVAFTMTGLSEEISKFQALSAFSGAGFTTDEAETTVKTPARRRIVALLIRLGSAGVVTSIATLLLSFIGAGEATSQRLLALVLGVVVLVGLAQSEVLNRVLTPLIEGGARTLYPTGPSGLRRAPRSTGRLPGRRNRSGVGHLVGGSGTERTQSHSRGGARAWRQTSR